MFISTSNFNVKEDGSVTGSQVLFDGGKVGGWTITENQFFKQYKNKSQLVT